jgi:hypothetical protein
MRLFAIVLPAAMVVLAVLTATAAYAGDNPGHMLAIHVKSHPTSCTEGYPSFPTCDAIQETYAGCGEVDIIPVFYDLVEFTGVEFGIIWSHFPSVSMVWTRCDGDASVGTIAHPGDGTVITWSTCQAGPSVAPGYGWLAISGAEYVCPAGNPVTGRYGVNDCSPTLGPDFDWSVGYSCAGTCGFVGDDPCRPVTARPSTWGAIKGIFK